MGLLEWSLVALAVFCIVAIVSFLRSFDSREVHSQEASPAPKTVAEHNAEMEAIRLRELQAKQQAAQKVIAQQEVSPSAAARLAKQKDEQEFEEMMHERRKQRNKGVEAERSMQGRVNAASYLIKGWRLEFPNEAAAIDEAAAIQYDSGNSALSAIGYESLRDDPEPMLRPFGSSGPGKREIEKARKARVELLADSEILRRIEGSPDSQALRQKIEEANRMEKERQRALDAEKKRKDSIEDWRRKFPLQSAGVSDGDVLRQIEASKNR